MKPISEPKKANEALVSRLQETEFTLPTISLS